VLRRSEVDAVNSKGLEPLEVIHRLSHRLHQKPRRQNRRFVVSDKRPRYPRLPSKRKIFPTFFTPSLPEGNGVVVAKLRILWKGAHGVGVKSGVRKRARRFSKSNYHIMNPKSLPAASGRCDQNEIMNRKGTWWGNYSGEPFRWAREEPFLTSNYQTKMKQKKLGYSDCLHSFIIPWHFYRPTNSWCDPRVTDMVKSVQICFAPCGECTLEQRIF